MKGPGELQRCLDVENHCNLRGVLNGSGGVIAGNWPKEESTKEGRESKSIVQELSSEICGRSQHLLKSGQLTIREWKSGDLHRLERLHWRVCQIPLSAILWLAGVRRGGS